MRSIHSCAVCLVLLLGCGGHTPSTANSEKVRNIVATLDRCPSLESWVVRGEKEKLVRYLLVAADNDLDDIHAAEVIFEGLDHTRGFVLHLLNRVVFDVPRPRSGQADGTWPLDVKKGRVVIVEDYVGGHGGEYLSFDEEFRSFRARYGRRDLAPFRRQKLEGFVDPQLRPKKTPREPLKRP